MMSLEREDNVTALDKLARIHAQLERPWGEALAADQVLLEHRAAELASRQNAATPEVTIPLLLFRLGGECYGLELAFIEKVLNWRPCVGLPGAPDTLLGLAEANGEILPIIDLERLLALPGAGETARGQIIMLGKPDARYGLHVASLEGIRHVALPAIHPPPVSLPAAGARYLRGITAEGIIVLDTEKMLSALELTIGHED
jgi:purine-binding chemotaxis protein CheW